MTCERRALAGLLPARTRTGRVGGTVSIQIYHSVRLTIQGRDCECEVMELADDLPVLVGQLPLEVLDFVVDPTNRRLIGNPDHGGQQMVDILGASATERVPANGSLFFH